MVSRLYTLLSSCSTSFDLRTWLVAMVLSISFKVSAQTITVYDGNSFTLQGTLIVPAACTAPITYTIGAVQGVTGVTAGVINPNTSINPTGAGTFTVTVSDNATPVPCNQVFNYSVASFNSAQVGTCFTRSITPVNVPAGCSVSYFVDGLPITLTGGNYDFQYGGNRVVTMRVTCGANVYNITRTIEVNGPDAQLTISGLQTSLDTGLDEMLEISPISSGNFIGVYPYCSSPSNSYIWNVTDGPHEVGHSSGNPSTIVYSHGSFSTSSNSIPNVLEIADPATNGGYSTLVYSTSGAGCTAIRTYNLFMSNGLAPGIDVGSPPVGDPLEWDPSIGFCYGDVVPIRATPSSTNADGTNYFLIITCSNFLGEIDNPGTVYSIDLSSQLPTSNSVYQFNWTADQSSCNCPGGSFNVEGFAQNPCNVIPISNSTQSFQVSADYTLDFTYPNNGCSLNPTIEIQGIQNTNMTSSICRPRVSWQRTNLQTGAVVTSGPNLISGANDNDRFYGQQFPEAGNYQLCLTTILTCGGSENTHTECHDICINFSRVATYDLVIPSGSNLGTQSAPVLCAPASLTGSVVLSAGFSCNAPVYNWVVTNQNSSTPLTGIITAGANTANPTFNFTTKGLYTITCSITGATCISPASRTWNITIAGPPQITFGNAPTICPNATQCFQDIVCFNDCFSPITNVQFELYPGSFANCTIPNGVASVYSSGYGSAQANPLAFNTVSGCRRITGCVNAWTTPAVLASTYTLIVTVNNGCGSFTSCLVISASAANITGVPSNVCANSALTLPQGCTWDYRPQSSNVWIPVTGPINVTAPIVVRQTCANQSCQPTQNVGVYPSFSATIAAPASACASTAFTLTTNTVPVGNYSYQWTNATPGAPPSTATATQNSGSQIYSVVVTDQNGCTANANVTIQVQSSATFAGVIGPLCSTDNYTFNLSTLISGGAAPQGSVSWTVSHNNVSYAIPAGTTNISLSTILTNVPTSTSVSTYTLAFSYTSAAGCTFAGSTTFDVNVQGTVNSPTSTLCANTSVPFSGNGTWSWTNAPVGVNAIIGVQNGYTFSPTIAMAGASTYVLSVNTGCSVTNYPIQVEYFNYNLSAVQNTVCYNSAATLSVAGAPANANYVWCQGFGPCTAPGLGSNAQFVTANLTTATTFAVTVNSGACAITNTISVNVAPQANYAPASIGSYCETSTSSIALSALGNIGASNLGSIGQWRWNNGAWSATPLSTVDIPTLISGLTINANITVPLDFQYTDVNGCQYQNSFTVEIQNQGVNNQLLQACSGTPLLVQPGSTGSWTASTVPQGATIAANNNLTFNPTPLQVGNYSMEFNSGCALTIYTVNVQFFTVTVGLQQAVICSGSSQVLTASTMPSLSGASFVWTDTNGAGAGNGPILTSPALAANTGYSVQVTSAQGCSYQASASVVVEPIPQFNSGVLPAYYCSNTNESLPLNAMVAHLGVYPANADWSWCGGSQQQSAPIAVSSLLLTASNCNVPTNGNITTNTITVNFTSAIGCPYAHDYTVSIKDYATQQINQTLCANEVVVMNGVAGGVWNVSALPTGANLSYSNNTTTLTWTPTLADANATPWIVRNEDPSCGASQFNILLKVVPTVSPTPIASTCLNTPQLLSTVSSADVVTTQWTYNGSNLSQPLFDPIALGIAPGTAVNICARVTNNVACQASQCFTINVIGLPTLFDPGGDYCLSTPYQMPSCNCSSYTLTLTPPTGAPIVWSNANTSYSFPDNTTFNAELVMVHQGCRDTLQAVMLVRDTPVASIDPSPYDVCAPVFTISNNSTGDDIVYTWSSDLALSNLNAELPSPSTIAVPMTNTSEQYIVALSVSNPCGTSSDQFIVDYLAAPQAFLDVVPISTNNCSPYCFELQAQNPSTPVVTQVTYDFNGFVPNVTTNTLSSIGELCWSVDSPQELPISVTIVNQCGSSSAIDSVLIVPAEVAAQFTVVPSLCPGENTVIDDQSFAEIGIFPTYSVSPNNGSVIINGNQLVIPQNAQSGDYIITQSIAACGSDTEHQTLSIGVVPTVTLLEPALGYCVNTGIPFTAAVQGSSVVFWDFGDGSTLLSAPTVIHEYLNPGEYVVTATATSSDGCTADDVIEVVLTGSDVEFDVLNDAICGNDPLIGIVEDSDWSDLVWQIETLSGEIIYTLTNRDTLKYVFPEAFQTGQGYNVVMRYTSLFGCTSTHFETVRVSPGVELSLSYSAATEACKFPVSTTLSFIGLGQGLQYFVSSPDLSLANFNSTLVNATFYFPQTVTVTAVSEDGCRATERLSIKCDTLLVYVPNAFTPDNDGYNEGIKPVLSGEVDYYRWTIFNRWGEVFFDSTDQDEYWYGAAKDGGEYFVPNDVYHWKLVTKAYNNAPEVELQGFIVMLK